MAEQRPRPQPRRPVAGHRRPRPTPGPLAEGPTLGAEAVDAPVRDDQPYEPQVREPDVREPDAREPDVREPDVREPGVQEPGRRGRGAGRRGLVRTAVVLAVLVALAAAAVGWLVLRARHDTATEDARTGALAAARSHATEILSYDYRRLDQDFARAEADTTGAFRDEYRSTSRTVVAPTATQYKAVVKASVAAASVVSATPERVVVLLFVNQTTTSTRVSAPKLDQSRVRMTLVRRGDRWLVSGIDAL